MPSIFISGIPRGLDRGAASLYIRKAIERVAQVKTIWIPKEKGYCFVSLHDETSADFVLSLNDELCINGNTLRLTRWKRKSHLSKTPRRTIAQNCKQQVTEDVFAFRGYDTYTSYKCHRPQTDILYQYIQQTPQKKRLKKKPWKNMESLSQLSSPKSRKNVRAKKRKKKSARHSKMKMSTSSLEGGLHFVSKRQKRNNFHSARDDDSSSNSPITTQLKCTSESEVIRQTPFDSSHTRSSATVHIYDHSERLGSIEVDNNNVLESIQAGLKSKHLPTDETILISHNGKTVHSQWQPRMADDDNIHIFVKGKGGMMQSDPPPDEGHNVDDKTKTSDSSGDGTQNSDAKETNAAEISVDDSEVNQPIQTNSTSTNPFDDNGVTDSVGQQTVEDKSVNKTEQVGQSPSDVKEQHNSDPTVFKAVETDKTSGVTPESPTEEESIQLCDDNGIPNANDTESTEHESVSTSDENHPVSSNEATINPKEDNENINTVSTESNAENPVDQSESEVTTNPSDDNEKPNAVSTDSDAKKTVDQSEQKQQTPDKMIPINPIDLNEKSIPVGTGSSNEESTTTSDQTSESRTEEKYINPSDDNGIPNTKDTASNVDESVSTFSDQTSESRTEEKYINPSDDNGIPNTNDTESNVDESVSTSDEKQAGSANEVTTKPSNDNEKPNNVSEESDAKKTVEQSEQKQQTPDEMIPINPTDVNEKSIPVGTVSSTDESTTTSVEDVRSNRLQQVIESSPFASTFLQGSEADQESLIDELSLRDYFPDQLRYESVMCISDDEKEEADSLPDIPMLLLRKLIMLDFTSRENELNVCFTRMNENQEELSTECQEIYPSDANDDFLSLFNDEDENIQDKSSLHSDRRNPVDIFLSIFICLHPTLKQKICSKMFACHLAIPIIFPAKKIEKQDKVLMFSMWPLRSITVHDGQTDTSLVNCKQNIVSFVRLGRPKISKSKLANEILSDTSHNAFFNYDCMLGSSKKRASGGLVEASWFLPSPKQPKKLQTVTLVLNLRGDAFHNAEQIEYLKNESRVMVIVTDKDTLKNKKDLEYFKRDNFSVLFLVTGKVSKEFLRKYKQYYIGTSPDCFNAEFIQGSEEGNIIGLSEIKETVLNVIGPVLNGTNSSQDLQEMSEQAQAMGMTVDENITTYKTGRLTAKQIFDEVKKCPLADIKSKFTPLQKRNWQEFTEAMKTFCKPGSDLHEKDRLEQKMNLQRSRQWDVFQNGNKFIKDFIRIFFKLQGDDMVSFLDSLKFLLDENSRRKMPSYRKKYAQAWDKFQSNSEATKAGAEQQLVKAEEKLSEASFGVEHIFRELGQIYEANWTVKKDELGSDLAKAVARSITLGYPFELMDGDVANVPLKWVERVFEELKILLGDRKLLTLSILGLQSSGKSTLLNAMFGLTFSVSAGRCTRGIYLQLFPVKERQFSFDYVLVVDTEGLRAPELGEQKYQHDNELATLVLGMADITIINIKGENTSEVKDILQICVHAFLRLKMANQCLQLRQSCIFIHQNVSDVGAKDAMIHARKKLDETLDKMTREAAEEENINDINCFKDVINFDSNTHVWYFSDLWKGDPPMAPANPGYSMNIREVKSFIFGTLTQHKLSYLTISDTFTHIKDLWNGILANDFVFSFRNSLEIKSYNALEREYQNLIWELEIYTKKLTKDAEVEMKKYTAECGKDNDKHAEMSKYTDKMNDEYQDVFSKKQLALRTELSNYFDKPDIRDEIVKWKNSKLCSWNVFAEEYLGKLKRQLKVIKKNCRVDYEMKTSDEKLKKEIYEQAKSLAEQVKGKEPSIENMKKEFNEMWDGWIKQLDVQEDDSIRIDTLLSSILYDEFRTHKDVLDTELKKHPLVHHKSFKPLENGLNSYQFDDNSISVKQRFLTKVKDSAIKVAGTLKILKSPERTLIDSKTNIEVIQFTNIIFKDIDARFEDLKKKEWKFDDTEMKETLKCIMQHITQHNQDKNKKFTLLEPYKVKLCVYVFGEALPLLTKLDSEYRRKYSIKAKLEKHQTVVWQHFQDVVAEKSVTLIACDRFCEIVRDEVEEEVKKNLKDPIYEHIITDFGKAKHELMNSIMVHLVDISKSEEFIDYIHDPYTYSFKWLTEYIDCKCFGDQGHLYIDKASALLQSLFTVISDIVKNESAPCLRDWLIKFQDLIHERGKVWIEKETFSVVEDQKVTDLDDFITSVGKKLEEVQKELISKFGRETAKTIKWSTKTTPYQMCMDKLWGCKALCPFCREPCKWNDKHTADHLCIQHRADGVAGTTWVDTNKLVIESCNFCVHSDTLTFSCRAACEGKCTVRGRERVFHPFKNYREYFPNWQIAPCPDISSSKYWAWVLCTFNEEFATHYRCKKADIPSSWKKYTKEDAITSLRG